MGEAIQAGLCLLGESGEDHGDVVSQVFAAGAGNDDAGAMDKAVVGGTLQGERHLSPGRERGWAAELDAVPVDDDRMG